MAEFNEGDLAFYNNKSCEGIIIDVAHKYFTWELARSNISLQLIDGRTWIVNTTELTKRKSVAEIQNDIKKFFGIASIQLEGKHTYTFTDVTVDIVVGSDTNPFSYTVRIYNNLPTYPLVFKKSYSSLLAAYYYAKQVVLERRECNRILRIEALEDETLQEFMEWLKV